MKKTALIALFACVLGLAGCGGSDGGYVMPPPEAARVLQSRCSDATPPGQYATVDGACVRTSNALGALRAPAATAAATITPAQLMDWAERTYPDLFPTTGKADGYSDPYTYRFYPQTANYIGVSTGSTDVAIYLYGNISAWNIVRIGPLSDYTCVVSPTLCEVRTLSISQFGSGSITTDGQALCTGGHCSRDYPMGATLTLTAAPSADWKFRYWSGCDTTSGTTCNVTLINSLTVHPMFERVAPPVMKPNTVELTAATMQHLVSKQGSALIFDNAASQIVTLSPGKVIYTTVGEGLLRRVTSVIALPLGDYIVDTADASVTDLISQGTLILDGRTSSTQLRANAPQRASLPPIPISLKNSSGDGFSASALVELSPEAALDIDFSGISEFKFVANPKVTLTNIQIGFGETTVEVSNTFAPSALPPITAGAIWVTPTAELKASLKAAVKVGVELGGQMGAGGALGVYYSRGSGWRGVGTYNLDGSFLAPDANKAKGSGEVEAALAFKAGLKIYGVAGPALTVTPYVNASATDTYSPTEACIRWAVKGGVRASASAEVSVLSFELAKYEKELVDQSRVFVDGTLLRCEDKEKPSTVTSGSVETLSDTKLRLTWLRATDNVAVVGYAITRNGKGIGTQASTTFIDANLQPDTEYCYTVAALDKAGNRGAESPRFCGRTKARDTQGPGAPGTTTATALSTTSVRLDWTAAQDTGGISGYVVYQDGKPVGQAAGTALSFVVGKLSPGTRYCFQVAAIDNAGNVGAKGAISCVTTKTTAAWTMMLRCDWATGYSLQQDVDLDVGNDQTLDVVGSGIDYNGVPLAYQLFGTYFASQGTLSGRLTWTFTGSDNVRSDEFTANFTSGDTGEIAMTQVQVTGCNAIIRFMRKSTGALAAPPLAYPRPGPGALPFFQR